MISSKKYEAIHNQIKLPVDRRRPVWIKGDGQLAGSIGSILLIQLGDIGDVVLTLSGVRALRENFPHAKIVVAVREKARELVEDCIWASDVIPISEGRRSRPPLFQLSVLINRMNQHF